MLLFLEIISQSMVLTAITSFIYFCIVGMRHLRSYSKMYDDWNAAIDCRDHDAMEYYEEETERMLGFWKSAAIFYPWNEFIYRPYKGRKLEVVK